jgi:hypothetical protein
MTDRPKCKLCGLEDGACICAHLPPRSSAGSDDLVARCKEVLDWHRTGLLNGGKGGQLRALAAQIEASGMPDHYALTLAEKQTADEAMKLVASGGAAQQPGMREALEAARSEIVVAISFLGRDLNTDRLTETVDSLITRLSKADADARAALAAQPPAAPVETRGAGVEMINNLTPSELANWQDDGNCNAGHAKCSAGTGEEWNPTSEQVGSACMWYRHDFGLLGPVEAAQVRTEARMWLRAWQKEIAGIRAAPQEASKP